MNPAKWIWQHSVYKVYEMIPAKLHQPLAAVGTVAVFLVGTMLPEETGDNTRANRAVSLFGLVVMIFVLTVTSRDWRKIPWHTVIGGMLTQFVIAVFVLRTQAGYDIFNFISFLARTLLSFAEDGVAFLTTSDVAALTWFLIGVVPPIIFFVALVQLLYHVGLLQWFIGKFATFFFWTLRVSGAEAVVAAATPFIGQGESAMLVRPFVPHLTLAEIHQVMCCGFATIAGSVLVAYIGLGLNAQALVSSCIMSIPASLAVSKMRYPETEETLTSGRVVVPEDQEDKATNSLHAFANGAWLGIKIAGMIIATLLCIIALVSLVNAFLTWWGKYWNISDPDLTLELILGYLLWPVAWLLGVPTPDVYRVAQLIGMKIIENEYVAFNALTTVDTYTSMGARSKLIATYACCVSYITSPSPSPMESDFWLRRASETLARWARRSVCCRSSLPDVLAMCRGWLCLRCSLESWPRSPRRALLACCTLTGWPHEHEASIKVRLHHEGCRRQQKPMISFSSLLSSERLLPS